MAMECCQVTFLILLCLLAGLLIGIWLDNDYNIGGVSGLWDKFMNLFKGNNSNVKI